MKVVSCRPAWVKTSNRFTTLFSQAVQNAGWRVREFSWTPAGLFAPKVVLLHWPDEMFTATGPFQQIKIALKLAVLNVARRLSGVRLVWVVHEATPHDSSNPAGWAKHAFLKSLDGVIYLSHASKLAAEADVPELKRVPALVTRHGHYRADMQVEPVPRAEPGWPMKLIYFGQIRPYKNLDGLIRAATSISPDLIRVRISGWSKDPDFTRFLSDLAANAPSVTLDIRDAFLPQVDLEAALDASDGVVLPYRKILNSGAALFALSRNRPVLAPRLGTLPELQAEIGSDWVELYAGDDILAEDLHAFAAMLRQAKEPVANLSRYEWDAVGDSIGAFLDQLVVKTRGARAGALEPKVDQNWP